MMETTKIWALFVGFGMMGFLLAAVRDDSKIASPPVVKDLNSFAVVELFTSEGCSSCPPADKLLGNIVKGARDEGKRIFSLAFHVDYWNDLGWKDIYSSSLYSNRQRNYARALGRQVYTPQMIVNGRDVFVGSNSARARREIQKSLKSKPLVQVELKDIQIKSDRELSIKYQLSGDCSQKILNIAIVERGIVRHVKRGENRGLTMHHENVVRVFRSIELNDTSGSASFAIPSEVDITNASVIAYVQNPDSKTIVGATGTNISTGDR